MIDNFVNRPILGIYKSRYIASWNNVCYHFAIHHEYTSCKVDFKDWLANLEIDGQKLSVDEIDEIVYFAENGKFELQENAADFLKNHL